MKTFSLFLLLFGTCVSVQAEDSLRVKPRRHEVGVDLTSFIKYYANFGNGNFDPGTSPYYVQYRFHLNSGNNIRAGIGGGYYDSEITSPYLNDINKYKNKYQFLNYRIGFEHFESLSARFQVFYGLDLLSGNSYQKNDASSWNGGYSNGNENKTTWYGAAPLLGIRFKLNKRLSLFTESSFQVNMNETWKRRFSNPINSSYPAFPDEPKTTSRSVDAFFNFPLFVVLAIDL